MDRLAGKVSLVTGGARGIGEATARRLVEEGAEVVIGDVNVDLGKNVASQFGNACRFVELDVASEESWAVAIDSVLATFGKLNVVVNNAGLVRVGTVEDETAAQFRFVTSVMMDGVFYGMKHGIRAIRQSGEVGSIINFASVTAISGYSPYFAYAASKGAVLSMTRSAAVHCQQQQYPIRVNAVVPGGIATPLAQNFGQLVESYVARTGNYPRLGIPKGPGTESFYPPGEMPDDCKAGPGIGDPVDVANVVVFLASDESRFVNGADIIVDNAASVVPA